MASPAASSDEGEIRDGGVEKATKSLAQFDASIDRQDRNRTNTSNSMSPEYKSRDRRSRDRSRSPYSDRQPRGSKRPRDDEFPDRSRDPRRFKVHYEDNAQDHHRRSRVSYEDLDRTSAASSDLRYDGRDRYPEKRPRTRSRSPHKSNRGSEVWARGGQSRRDVGRSKDSGYRDSRGGNGSNGYGGNREYKDQSVSKRGQSPLPADNARHEAKSTQGNLQRSINDSANHTKLEK